MGSAPSSRRSRLGGHPGCRPTASPASQGRRAGRATRSGNRRSRDRHVGSDADGGLQPPRTARHPVGSSGVSALRWRIEKLVSIWLSPEVPPASVCSSGGRATGAHRPSSLRAPPCLRHLPPGRPPRAAEQRASPTPSQSAGFALRDWRGLANDYTDLREWTGGCLGTATSTHRGDRAGSARPRGSGSASLADRLRSSAPVEHHDDGSRRSGDALESLEQVVTS
jgi:hypothetical protein